LVTVLAVAPLFAVFHQASTRHAVCEHGALIETDHATVDRVPDDEPSSSRTREFQTGDAAVHDHVHCTVATLAKASATILPPTRTVTAALEIARVESFDVELASERAVLDNAPKTSPPEEQIQALA
jgi:hypothetical protein